VVARDEIGLGVIGCGDVALRTYAPGIALSADRAPTVAVFDPDPMRAELLATDLEARGLGRPRIVPALADLLTAPDVAAVFNLTPAPFHHEVNVAALHAGKHVFSEKPLAATVAEARDAINLARTRGLTLLCAPAVMTTNRFRWLKERLGGGWLGRPTLAVGQMANMGPASWLDYKGDPAVFYSEAVGPALDTGVYILHAVTGLLGPARRVEAFGGIAIPHRNVLIPGREGQVIEVSTPDHLLIHLDFGDNRFAQVLSSFATPRSKAPALEIHGDGGTVSISQESWYDPDAPVEVLVRDEQAAGQERWEEVIPSGPSRSAHLIGSGPEHFVAVLAGLEAPILTAEHAAHVLEIILAAGQSVREGRAIVLSRGIEESRSREEVVSRES
jgi:predicted dehydrogenase